MISSSGFLRTDINESRTVGETHVEMLEDTLDLEDGKWRVVKRRLTGAGVETQVQKVVKCVVVGVIRLDSVRWGNTGSTHLASLCCQLA